MQRPNRACFISRVLNRAVAFSTTAGLIVGLGVGAPNAFAADAVAPEKEMPSAPPNPNSPSARAFIEKMRDAMDTMQGAMKAAPLVGDPDRDFAAVILPHHQGAIDMAKLYLQRGTDPELRRMARRIIAAQQKDVNFLKKWIEQHPKPMALEQNDREHYTGPSLLSAR